MAEGLLKSVHLFETQCSSYCIFSTVSTSEKPISSKAMQQNTALMST